MCPRLIVYWMRASTAETLQNTNDEGSFYLTLSAQTSTVIATINYRRQTRCFQKRTEINFFSSIRQTSVLKINVPRVRSTSESYVTRRVLMISAYHHAEVKSAEQSYKKKVWRWRSRKVGGKIYENKSLMVKTKINIYWPLLICSEYNFGYIQNFKGRFWIGNISFKLNTTTSLNQHSWIFSR